MELQNNKSQIIDELNVKSINFVNSEEEIVKYELKPNFNVIGQKYGKDVKVIVSLLNKVNIEDFKNELKSKDMFSLAEGKFKILREDINILEHAKENYSLSSSKDIIVSLNIAFGLFNWLAFGLIFESNIKFDL